MCVSRTEQIVSVVGVTITLQTTSFTRFRLVVMVLFVYEVTRYALFIPIVFSCPVNVESLFCKVEFNNQLLHLQVASVSSEYQKRKT